MSASMVAYCDWIKAFDCVSNDYFIVTKMYGIRGVGSVHGT